MKSAYKKVCKEINVLKVLNLSQRAVFKVILAESKFDSELESYNAVMTEIPPFNASPEKNRQIDKPFGNH